MAEHQADDVHSTLRIDEEHIQDQVVQVGVPWLPVVPGLQVLGSLTIFRLDTRCCLVVIESFLVHHSGDTLLKWRDDAHAQDIPPTSQNELRGSPHDDHLSSRDGGQDDSFHGRTFRVITRTRGPFWSIPPAHLLLRAVLETQLLATLITVYGLFMAPIGWGLAGLVWGYALLWFLVEDRVKLAAYRLFDWSTPGFLALLQRTGR